MGFPLPLPILFSWSSLVQHSCCVSFVILWLFQTFSELIEAASNGNQRGIDQFNDEFLTNPDCAEGDENVYSIFVEHVKLAPSVLFCFGKAVDSENGSMH